MEVEVVTYRGPVARKENELGLGSYISRMVHSLWKVESEDERKCSGELERIALVLGRLDTSNILLNV